MVELINPIEFNKTYFYERLYAVLLEDGHDINYGDFHAKILANGIKKVLKSLNLYKVTGARDTKKTFVHPKLMLIINTTIAENDIIAQTIIDMVAGKFNGIDKFNIQDFSIYNSLSNDYPVSIDTSKCTYIFFNPENNLYKIGRSGDIFHRLNQLKCEISKEIEVCCYKNSDIEGFLHKEYINKRVYGEWFSLTKDDVLDIYNKHDFKIIKL